MVKVVYLWRYKLTRATETCCCAIMIVDALCGCDEVYDLDMAFGGE